MTKKRIALSLSFSDGETKTATADLEILPVTMGWAHSGTLQETLTADSNTYHVVMLDKGLPPGWSISANGNVQRDVGYHDTQIARVTGLLKVDFVLAPEGEITEFPTGNVVVDVNSNDVGIYSSQYGFDSLRWEGDLQGVGRAKLDLTEYANLANLPALGIITDIAINVTSTFTVPVILTKVTLRIDIEDAAGLDVPNDYFGG